MKKKQNKNVINPTVQQTPKLTVSDLKRILDSFDGEAEISFLLKTGGILILDEISLEEKVYNKISGIMSSMRKINVLLAKKIERKSYY